MPVDCRECGKRMPPDTPPDKNRCDYCEEKVNKGNEQGLIVIWILILIVLSLTAWNGRYGGEMTWGFVAAIAWLLTFWLIPKLWLAVKIVATIVILGLCYNIVSYCISPTGKLAAAANQRSIAAANAQKDQTQAQEVQQQQAEDAAQAAQQQADAANQQKAAQNSMEAKEDAYFEAQHFVNERLKAPDSAKYPHLDESQVQLVGDNLYAVSGYVDSQNSFGAMLRSHWTAKLYKESEDSWVLKDIHIDDPD